MIREYLNFRIELVNPKDENESDQFARDFVHSFGLKTYSGTWSGIYLDSPMFYDFLIRAKELINNRVARFAGFCSLSQLIEDEGDIEWYVLNAKNDLAIEDYDEIITCRADKMSPNVHTAHGIFYNVYVSEKFMNVVKENQLTGVDFVWIKDVGKFQASQWYIPVVFSALGRGFDHPWFDSRTLRGTGSHQPLEPEFRCGTYKFEASQIKKDIIFEKSLYREIINLFDPEILSIISYRSFLRDFLPNTDFAFIWHSTDQERKRGNYGVFFQEKDGVYKQRELCISKRTKDILLKSNLITTNELEPIKICSTIPDGIEMLDGKALLPTPFYSCGYIDLDSVKKKLEKEWTSFISRTMPAKTITQRQALKYLLEAKKLRPEDFNKAVGKSELTKVRISLPVYWVEVLKKTNGGFLNYECTLVPLEQISEFSKEKQKYSEEVWEDYPQNLIHVAHSIDGDWYSLELAHESEIDCRVKRISHETCQLIREWDSIAMFIFDMLAEYSE